MQFGDGTVFSEWLSLDLRDTWTDPLGDMRFEAAPGRERIALYQDKLKKGELVTVFINGANQGGFLIQTVTTQISKAAGVTFSIACHTPLITPYQGSVDPKLSFKSQTDSPVGKIVLDALGPYGFDTEIDGDNTANVSAITGKPLQGGAAAFPVDALKQDQACAQDGETAYQFCARILTRLGIAMHVNFDGAILIRSPDYGQDPIGTLVVSADPTVGGDRFFDNVEIVDTNDNQFSECIVTGNPNDKAGTKQTTKPEARVTTNYLFPNRPAYKSTVASYKPLIIKDKNARDYARCLSVAKLALGIRAKEAFVISGTVAGFASSTTGAVWTAGTIVNVQLDPLNFREPMFVLECHKHRSRDAGDICRFRLIPLGALQLGDAPGA